MAKLLLVVVSLLTINSALAARILGISGASSGSHYFVVKKTMEELSSRGHEVCNPTAPQSISLRSKHFRVVEKQRKTEKLATQAIIASYLALILFT